MTTGLPTRAPRPTLETAPFWEGAARHRFVLPRCDRCSEWIWYPRRLCPSCAGTDISWHEVSGRGSVYSYTIVHSGLGPYAPATPYVIAYVELDEGVRVLTNITGCAPENVRIGLPVEVVWDDAPDGGGALYRFTPSATANGKGTS